MLERVLRQVLVTMVILSALCLSQAALAVVEIYEFEQPRDRARYDAFVEEMRCPKCQNQNLAGSDSPIAKDLRRELYRLLDEGRSDKEIVDFMVARYGDYILYRPKLQANTLMLWLIPALLLLAGLWLLLSVLRARRRAPADSLLTDEGSPIAAGDLSQDEQRRLTALLGEQAESGECQPIESNGVETD